MKQFIVNVFMAAMLLDAAGCRNNQQANNIDGSDFAPDSQQRNVQRFVELQSARGARADATLRDSHFDGEAVNSLGREKLDLMLKDGEAPNMVAVFLDLTPGESDQFGARKDSVVAYLKDAGLSEGQIKIVRGPNLATNHPTASDQHALSALGSSSGSGGVASGSIGSSSPMAPSAPH